jgi:RNA polymerase sigma-70 factor, ECF subfamily
MHTWGPEDRDLARRARDGDERAFGLLVERFQDPVYRLCSRFVGASEAEDLTQETFVRAFVHAGSYDPARPMLPWLLAIARRLCLDRLRKAKPDLVEDTTVFDDGGPDAEQQAMTRQDVRRLQAVLPTLPEGQREALALFHVEGLAYQEIATTLDVPIGTVMTWLHRARARLKQALQERSPT